MRLYLIICAHCVLNASENDTEKTRLYITITELWYSLELDNWPPDPKGLKPARLRWVRSGGRAAGPWQVSAGRLDPPRTLYKVSLWPVLVPGGYVGAHMPTRAPYRAPNEPSPPPARAPPMRGRNQVNDSPKYQVMPFSTPEHCF